MAEILIGHACCVREDVPGNACTGTDIDEVTDRTKCNSSGNGSCASWA
jgi:hypothetical protein